MQQLVRQRVKFNIIFFVVRDARLGRPVASSASEASGAIRNDVGEVDVGGVKHGSQLPRAAFEPTEPSPNWTRRVLFSCSKGIEFSEKVVPVVHRRGHDAVKSRKIATTRPRDR